MTRFIRACWREPVDATPVWFMRQAGRYLPGYREIRRQRGVLDIARAPDLAAQVALEPVRTLGVDAAILFADITLPLQAMGFPIDIEADVGPVTDRPIRTPEDVARLGPFDPERAPFVAQTIALLKQKLGPTPLIGFSGAPFTLAGYLIEGRPSKEFARTKEFMWRFPSAWADLLRRLAEAMGHYLRFQAEAGADALQVFDSWVGALSPADYESHVAPATSALFRGLRETGVPTIHFGTGTATLVSSMRDAGGDVLSVDWRQPLDDAWRALHGSVAIQGNLDPAALLAPRDVFEAKVRDVMERAGGQPGHIFNLGHGVLPATPVESARRVVELVHSLSSAGG